MSPNTENVTYWLVDLIVDGEPVQNVALGSSPDHVMDDVTRLRFDRVVRMRRVDTETAVEILQSEEYE